MCGFSWWCVFLPPQPLLVVGLKKVWRPQPSFCLKFVLLLSNWGKAYLIKWEKKKKKPTHLNLLKIGSQSQRSSKEKPQKEERWISESIVNTGRSMSGGGVCAFPWVLLHLLWKRACSLFSLICTTLQVLQFLKVINAASPNLKSGLSLWELIKYLFLVDLLCRACYDTCLHGLGIWFFSSKKTQAVFVYETLYQALQVALT